MTYMYMVTLLATDNAIKRYLIMITSGVLTLITLRAKLSGAVYCYRSCLWRVCNGRAGGRAVSVTTITWNCVHRFSPNWVCRCRVATISSWLNFGGSAPREGGLRRAKIFGSALLQPARSVCVSLSVFFILYSYRSAGTIVMMTAKNRKKRWPWVSCTRPLKLLMIL